MPAEKSLWDLYAERHGCGSYGASWVRAWGSRYPADVAPYSSCTTTLLAQVREEVAKGGGDVLADLGCGVGGPGLWLARELGMRLEGVDCSASAVEIARRRIPDWGLDGRARFRVGDFARTGLDTASVDAAISIDALPFAKDIDAAFAEARRILRTGGRLIFTTREPRANSPKRARFGVAHRAALTRAGFALDRALDRGDVTALWQSLYHAWIEDEQALRAELPAEVADSMIAEAKTPIGPEERPWLLITAVAA